jgi:hypothetical protein
VESKKQPQLTEDEFRRILQEDHALLMALLNVVGSLAHELTGKWPMICVGGGGTVTHFTLGLDDVAWFKDPMDAKCSIHTEEWFKKLLEKKSREEKSGSDCATAKDLSPC